MPGDAQNVTKKTLKSLAKDVSEIVARKIKINEFVEDAGTKFLGNRVIGDNIFEFTLKELPGCCAFLISTATFVDPKYRQLGIGHLLQKYKEIIARDWGYTNLIATTTEKNKIQTRIMNKAGWEMLFHVMNENSGNVVLFWRKELCPKLS